MGDSIQMTSPIYEVPILITSFVRHESLKVLFNIIRNLKPARLFLVSDGPRKNYSQDIYKIEKCREILSGVDWECDVHHIYFDENMGILEAAHKAIRFAFGLVDELILFEDDSIPSVDFFYFADEMLSKYKDDERILLISGSNPYNINRNIESDYFFSKFFTSGAVCYWKRTYDSLVNTHELLKHNKINLKAISKKIDKTDYQLLLDASKLSDYSDYFSFEKLTNNTLLLNNQIGIIPKNNLVSCNSISDDSAHSYDKLIILPKVLRNLQNFPLETLGFPIHHPTIVLDDVRAKKEVFRILAIRHPLIQIYRHLYTAMMLVRFGKFVILKQRIIRYWNQTILRKYDKNG
jgi:hypothetical protein